MAVRKPKTQPTPPTPKRQPSASIRRPVTDVDDRISRALERLMPEGMPRYRLAELAGRDASHAARLFQRPPRQTWTIEDLSDVTAPTAADSVGRLLASPGRRIPRHHRGHAGVTGDSSRLGSDHKGRAGRHESSIPDAANSSKQALARASGRRLAVAVRARRRAGAARCCRQRAGLRGRRSGRAFPGSHGARRG